MRLKYSDNHSIFINAVLSLTITMFIKQFTIKYFRNIETLDLYLNKGLNIFIGENNSGKTTVIDALRICLGWCDQDKNIFVKPEDVYLNRSDHTFKAKPIEFDIIFEIEEKFESSIFYDLLSKSSGQLELQIHYRFWFEEKLERKLFRYSIWGGDNEGQIVPTEVFDLIRHIYLGALRDAARDLQLNKGNKLGSLLEKIEPDKNRQAELAKKLDNLLHSDHDWKTLREEAKDEINWHLNQSSIKGKEIKVDLRFLDLEFRKLVGDLRARVPVYPALSEDDPNQDWFQIIQNGLGDNNRIYIASVLGDLLGIKKREQEAYVALLIEEPEAHLHPQLQNTLFTYFGLLANEIQVFITSHSPTITAKTILDTILVFQNIKDKICVLSLSNSELDQQDKSYLHKFLDVTKAQLFFANGIILVEGICEALLFPIFAKIMDRIEGGENKYNLTKAGVEIVNVDGVSFRSFARIFNSSNEEKRLNSKCVIVTDSDPPNTGTERSARAQNALELKSGLLDVQFSTKTFEYDLFQASKNNAQIMKKVYKDMHPRTEIADANDFLEKLKSNKDKGEFAQRLAEGLDNDSDSFVVPEYIQKAIRWVTQDNI